MSFAHSSEVVRLKRRIESLEAENAELWVEVKAFRAIVSESAGVAGWHVNGNIATWDEMNIPYAAYLPPTTDKAAK